jgi:hypothetical protein
MHHLLVLILFVQLAAAFWRSNCLMDVQSRKLHSEKGTNKGRFRVVFLSELYRFATGTGKKEPVTR